MSVEGALPVTQNNPDRDGVEGEVASPAIQSDARPPAGHAPVRRVAMASMLRAPGPPSGDASRVVRLARRRGLPGCRRRPGRGRGLTGRYAGRGGPAAALLAATLPAAMALAAVA